MAVTQDKNMANTFLKYYYGIIPSEFLDIVLTYFCCHINSQDVQTTFGPFASTSTLRVNVIFSEMT